MRKPFILAILGVTASLGATTERQNEPASPLSIEHILRIPTFVDFAVSPDGKLIAMTARFLGRENIYLVSDPEKPAKPLAPTEVASEAEAAPTDEMPVYVRDREPDWSPDGKLVAFVSDRADGWHLYVIEPENDEPLQLTRHRGEDRRPRWSPDGKNIAFLSRRLGSETGWDVWTIPAEGGTPRRLSQDPLDEENPRWSPDGKWIAYTYRAGRHVNRRLAMVPTEPASEIESRDLLPQAWEGDSHSARWSPDGKRLAFVSDHDGRKRIYIIDAEGGEPEPLLASELEETEPVWSPDGSEIAHISNREGNLRLAITSLSTRRSRSLTLGSGVSSLPQWTGDGEGVYCLFEGPTYPRDVWVFQKGGSRRHISESLFRDIDVRKMIRPEIVRFQSFDGHTITGFLYLPLDASPESPAPLIVHPHGGPTSQWRNGWHPVVQLLAQRGYAVFAPNVRGSSGFGLEFENLNDGDWGRGDVEDLVLGTRELARRPEIRADRIAIWGVSYGGFLTLASIGRHPDLFTCAIEAVGMPDLVNLYRETSTEGLSYLEREIGTLRGNLKLYRDLSPGGLVDKVKTPLLSFHGEDYPLVPYSTKRPYVAALKQRRSPVTEYLFKGDMGRATYRFDLYPGVSQFYIEKILEFFEIYL